MTRQDRESSLMLDGQRPGRIQAPKPNHRLSPLRVEYPTEGEVIAQPSYTLQIAATPGTQGVEVSIDRGEWVPCREALGLWWHDWSDYSSGEHVVAARTISENGASVLSGTRHFSAE